MPDSSVSPYTRTSKVSSMPTRSSGGGGSTDVTIRRGWDPQPKEYRSKNTAAIDRGEVLHVIGARILVRDAQSHKHLLLHVVEIETRRPNRIAHHGKGDSGVGPVAQEVVQRRPDLYEVVG